MLTNVVPSFCIESHSTVLAPRIPAIDDDARVRFDGSAVTRIEMFILPSLLAGPLERRPPREPEPAQIRLTNLEDFRRGLANQHARGHHRNLLSRGSPSAFSSSPANSA